MPKGNTRPGLTPRQWAFAQAFCAGETKGNATQSYLKAFPGVKYTTAKNNGSALLTNTAVVQAIQRLHIETRAATLAEMEDWQVLGVEAQQRLLGIMRDDPAIVPIEEHEHGHRRDAAFVAQQVKIILEILERGWPKAHRVLWENSKETLAGLMGIDPTDLP